MNKKPTKSSKRGPAPKAVGGKNVSLTIKLPANMKEAAKKLIRKKGVSLASVLRQSLQIWISGG